MDMLKNLFHKWGVVIICLPALYASFFLIPGYPEHNAIRGDGLGYYAYLPGTFIYHDLTFEFTKETDYYTDFWSVGGEARVNKYFSGVAILLLPFFMLAHILSLILGYPADGYSLLYQYAVSFAAVFYLFIGLRAMQSLLEKFYKNRFLVLFILFVLVFGTNLIHYVYYDPSMSHIYSFSMISIFLWGTYRVIHEKKKTWIVITALAFSMIVFIRPVNALVILLIPFLAGDLNTLKEGFLFLIEKYKNLFLGLLLALIPVFLQMLAWYIQSGHWIVYSYGNEGFNWDDPEPTKFLFSYRKGWFLWTPLAFLGVIGFLVLPRKNLFRFAIISIFWAALIYVQSSWHSWMYGMSYGSRPMVEHLSVAVIGLAIFFSILPKLPKALLIIVILILTGVNLIQAYQYKYYIIHWDGMVKETYWDVFLKTAPEYEGWIWKHTPGFMTAREKFLEQDLAKTFTIDFEDKPEEATITDKLAHSGQYANMVNKKHAFSHANSRLLSIEEQNKYEMIQASLWYSGQKPMLSLFVVSINGLPQPVWKDIPLVNYYEKDQEWSRAVLHLPMPKDTTASPELKVFAWNTETNEKFYVDDIRIDFLPNADTSYQYQVMIK